MDKAHQKHPITPPPELLQQWAADYWGNPGESIGAGEKYIATQAARWGADQELEACCAAEHTVYGEQKANWLRSLRRPKPPSLAEQGQRILVENGRTLDGRVELDPEDVFTIRAALERLQELENND